MCKGTTNGEDIYLIDIDHIPHKEKYANPKWIEYHGGIPVDECIGKEIEHLIYSGVITVGTCCGHGTRYPQALVMGESRDILEEMGYVVREYSEEHTKEDIYEIELKG